MSVRHSEGGSRIYICILDLRILGGGVVWRLGFQSACSPDMSDEKVNDVVLIYDCLLYTSPSPRDLSTSRMPSSA